MWGWEGVIWPVTEGPGRSELGHFGGSEPGVGVEVGQRLKGAEGLPRLRSEAGGHGTTFSFLGRDWGGSGGVVGYAPPPG